MKKYPKFVLILVIFCLIGAGVFCFLNIQKKESAQTKTTPNLKLLTSHSSPQAGEKWVVSFETIGIGDLTITPKDSETVGDLDFISLTCNGEERTLQILENDAIFYTNWQCAGKGELTHLVNIARKHTLKFSFGNLSAFAYNNPDSVTDTFSDTSKIAATSSVVVIGGQVKLVKTNGTACSSGSECGSGYCVDSVCCNNICDGTPCYRCDSYSNAGAGTCGYVSTAVDPDNECTTATPPAADSCKSATCNGTGYACGYLAAGEQSQPVCKRCNGSSYDPVNVTDDTGDSEGSNKCDATSGDCYRCSSGSCTYQTVAQDLFLECPDSQCYTGTCSGSSYTCGYQTSSQDIYTYCTAGACNTGNCAGGSNACGGPAIDSQPSGCTGCNWCNGTGQCKACSWSRTNTYYDWGGWLGAIFLCKASTAGIIGYSASNPPACSGSTREDYKGTGEVTIYEMMCTCN